jgi:16S rRNA (guanine966-N2)-methyltransferase
VVAGSAGGLRLAGPASGVTRPTTDKVRGAIFNSLESLGVVEGASIVDLFAGTGACGVEALSRGAGQVTFVENDRRAIEVIRANLASTGTTGKVVRSDVLTFLATADTFDLAFADPPYSFTQWAELLAVVDAPLVVCESRNGVEAPEGWESVRERRYGDTTVTIIRRQ